MQEKEKHVKKISSIHILLLYILIVLLNCNKNEEVRMRNEVKPEEIYKYVQIEKRPQADTKEVLLVESIRVLIDEIPDENKIQLTAKYLWENEKEKFDEIYLKVYLPDLNESGEPYYTIEFDKKGMTKIMVNGEALLGTKWAPNILKYHVLAKNDYGSINNPRMDYKIILDVDKLPSKEMLRKTSYFIWENGNKKYKEFTINIFLSDTYPYPNSEAYAIAEFTGLGGKNISIRKDALKNTKYDINHPQKSPSFAYEPPKSNENSFQIINGSYKRHISNIARKCSTTERAVEIDINNGLSILKEKGKPTSLFEFTEAIDRAIPEEAVGSGLTITEVVAAMLTLMIPSKR
jgi:hypothetical protein